MKIILAGPYPKGTKEKFQKLLAGCKFLEAQTQEEYDALSEGDVIVVRVLKTPEKTLENKPSLKAVIRWGAGYDSVDIQAAGKRGIPVATTPGANAYAVSGLAVALMLSIGRNLMENAGKTREGIWDNKIFSSRMTTLNHKIVGIIGGGNIGRSVARQVQSFGARTVYYDISRLSLETEAAYSMEYADFDTLLARSDVVTLHIPLLEGTRHIIGREELSKMKPGAILINTARGGLVDDNALAEAVLNGHLLGAGLDCVENENLSESPFKNLEHVILTPHMGGTCTDLADEMIPRIAAQIRMLMEKGTLQFVVNQAYITN